MRVLLCCIPENQERLSAFLEGFDLDVVIYNSLEETLTATQNSNISANALFVDIETQIKEDAFINSHKMELLTLAFPTQILKEYGAGAQIGLLGSNPSNAKSAMNFFLFQARNGKARSLRGLDRVNARIDLEISPCTKGCPEKEPLKVVATTVNLSTKGAFIATSHPFKVGSLVSLKILQLNDSVLVAEVKWHSTSWSGAKIPPGIGVEFLSLSIEQKRGIHQLMDLATEDRKTFLKKVLIHE